MMAGVQKATVE